MKANDTKYRDTETIGRVDRNTESSTIGAALGTLLGFTLGSVLGSIVGIAFGSADDSPYGHRCVKVENDSVWCVDERRLDRMTSAVDTLPSNELSLMRLW